MNRTIPIALLVASVVTLAFAACTGGSDWDPPAWVPPPSPTRPAPRDCADLGGTCQPAACEYGRGCHPSGVVCRSTPPTAECGDVNRPAIHDGPRCCVPLDLDDAGWLKLPFDPECGLSFAHGDAPWPPPLQWETCSPELEARLPGCSWIRMDWPAGEGPYAGRVMDEAQAASFEKQYKTTHLVVSRISGRAAYRMIVRLEDGFVAAAFRETQPSCSVSHADLYGSAYALTVTRKDGEKIVKAGVLRTLHDYVPYAGEIPDGSEPRHFIDQGSILATPANVIREYRHYVDGGSATFDHPLPVEGALTNVVLRGNVVFFAGRDARWPKIEVAAEGKVRQLLGFGEDVTSGAADFGTDGRDMVWTEASGRTAPGEPWSRIDIMTAPYTNMPELIGPTIQKRRLRSERSFGEDPFMVACEHAAHAVGTNGVRIVRLTDGRSWMLPNAPSDDGTSWQVTSPLAVTCDEVIVRLRRGDEHQVARIPFSMFGPGEAAD